MPNRILTAISPTNSVQVANVQWTTLLQVTQPVTDGSNKAVYTADLTTCLTSGGAVYVRWTDAYTNDDWGPSVDQVTVTADGNMIASFQLGSAGETPYVFDLDSSQTASAWRFADGTEYFIYKFVPPAGTKKTASLHRDVERVRGIRDGHSPQRAAGQSISSPRRDRSSG